MKRQAFQNKRIRVPQLAFRACKVLGTLEKQATGFGEAGYRISLAEHEVFISLVIVIIICPIWDFCHFKVPLCTYILSLYFFRLHCFLFLEKSSGLLVI